MSAQSAKSTRRKKGKQHFFAAIVIILIVAAALAGYFAYARYYPSTQDSYVHANISTISTKVNGQVNTVEITDLSFVKVGDILFTLDKTPFQIQLDQALANLANARQIVAAKHAPGGDDNPLIRQAKASLAGAQLALKNTIVHAPASGQLVNVRLRKGNNIAAGMPLFSIVEQQNWWIQANFKETDLARIKVGQPATVKVDIYPHHVFHGVVEALSQSSGAIFSLLPPENATGNWVKVTQRFPVRIRITNLAPAYPLRVGASATVKIDTRQTSQ